jgi:hypothetical protein
MHHHSHNGGRRWRKLRFSDDILSKEMGRCSLVRSVSFSGAWGQLLIMEEGAEGASVKLLELLGLVNKEFLINLKCTFMHDE